MASVKLAFGSVTSMTVTNLHSLASSTTAGWQSAVVDNSSDLYLDAHVQIILDFANTAPANSKGVYVFAYSALETSYTNPASGSEGSITLLDVTANAQALRQIGFIPYTTQDEIVESANMSVAAGFGGILPIKWGIVLMNHSGAALHSSGNTVKWAGVYATVA